MDEDQIQEVEESSTPPGDGESQAAAFLSLENLIKNHLATIDKLQKDTRELQEAVTNILANDPTYKQHEEQAKEAARIKGNTKKEILKRPEVAHTAQKLKETQEELKDNRVTLSELLQEYQRQSGQNTLETEDGRVLEIVSTSKLVVRSAK